MSRARGGPPAAGGGPQDAHVARIRQRLARMSPQTEALRLALARYHDDTGRIDLTLWEAAFTSNDPQPSTRFWRSPVATRALSTLLMEMLHAGTALVRLPVARQRRRPQAPDPMSAFARRPRAGPGTSGSRSTERLPEPMELMGRLRTPDMTATRTRCRAQIDREWWQIRRLRRPAAAQAWRESPLEARGSHANIRGR